MGPDDLAEVISTYERDREKLRGEITRLRQKVGESSAVVDEARATCDDHGPNFVCRFCKFFRPENVPTRPRATAGQEGEI